MKDRVNYTTINHIAREKLDLTWIEYGLVDLVHNLSNNPKSESRWCYASKQTLADNLGVTKQYVHKMINKMISKGLIEKNDETNYLRTTEMWYESIVLQDSKQSLLPVNKVYSDSKQSLLPIYNNNNNNKKIYKKTSRNSLIRCNDDEVVEIASKYKISTNDVKLTMKSLDLVIEEKPKKYKRYRTTLEKWILNGIKWGNIKVLNDTPISDSITPINDDLKRIYNL